LHILPVCNKTETDLLLGDCDSLPISESDIPAPRGTGDVVTARQKRDRIADML